MYSLPSLFYARCALTGLISIVNNCTTSSSTILSHLVIPSPPANASYGLRYLRDRINVPRDMSIFAAKHLRNALEQAAVLSDANPASTVGRPEAIPLDHRRDQNPKPFSKV